MKLKDNYAAYREFLYQFFLKNVKIPALAADLTQDVFIKFWIRRDEIHDIDNFDAWLFTLARNHLSDHYRKLASEKIYQKTVWNHMERHSNLVMLDIYKRELEMEIESLLEKLSPRQKEIYLLSRREGLTLEEIASHLKISPNTAKNHLVHALKVIRTGLHEHQSSISFIIGMFMVLGL